MYCNGLTEHLFLTKTTEQDLVICIQGKLIYGKRTEEHKSTIYPHHKRVQQQHNVRNMLQGFSGSRHSIFYTYIHKQ